MSVSSFFDEFGLRFVQVQLVVRAKPDARHIGCRVGEQTTRVASVAPSYMDHSSDSWRLVSMQIERDEPR